MRLLSPLMTLLRLRARIGASVGRTVIATATWAATGVLLAAAFGVLMAALYQWLAVYMRPHEALLLTAAAIAVIALFVLLVGQLIARARARRQTRAERSEEQQALETLEREGEALLARAGNRPIAKLVGLFAIGVALGLMGLPGGRRRGRD